MSAALSLPPVAPPLLAAQRGGAAPEPARQTMLPVRQTIDALRGLRSEPKRVLAEVCGLFEMGGRSECTAKNRHFTDKFGMPTKSVSRLLAGLQALGLITVEVRPELGNRRYLRPTPACRALYDPAEPASPWSAARPNSQSGDTPKVGIPTSVSEDTPKVGIATPQSGDTLPPKVGIPSPPKWGELTKNSEEQLRNTEEQVARLTAALAASEEKVAALAAQLAELKTQPAPPATPPVAPLPPPPPTPRRRRVAHGEAVEPGTQTLIDAWSDWYLERYKVRPRVTAGDAKAAKELVAYLRGQSKNKDDAGALAGLRWLLAGWNRYDGFTQKQTSLRQIAANVNNLIAALRGTDSNGRTSKAGGPATAPANYHTAQTGVLRKRAFSDDE